MARCTAYQAPELRIALDYFLGDFGFEKIFEVEGVVTPKTAKGRPPGSKNKRRRYISTRRVSRGMAKAKVVGVKRTTHITLIKADPEDGGDE